MRSSFERSDNIDQRSTRRSADCRILLAQELLRFRRPRHQLAIETHPIRLKLLPKARILIAF